MTNENLEPTLKPLNCCPSKLPFSTVPGGGEPGPGRLRTGPRRYEVTGVPGVPVSGGRTSPIECHMPHTARRVSHIAGRQLLKLSSSRPG